MKPTPIKRHEALKALSREHHHGLLLSWKIREGLKRDIDPARIKRYTDWFWNAHLKSHFEIEEKYVFSILPADHELVVQALSEHRQLEELFHSSLQNSEDLTSLATTLDQHIRFEERMLFGHIQEVATPDQLKLVEKHHSGSDSNCENWDDEFWKTSKP